MVHTPSFSHTNDVRPFLSKKEGLQTPANCAEGSDADLSQLRSVPVDQIKKILVLARAIDDGYDEKAAQTSAEISLRTLLEHGSELRISAGSIVQALATLIKEGEVLPPELNLSHLIQKHEAALQPSGIRGCRSVVEEQARQVQVDSYISTLQGLLKDKELPFSKYKNFSITIPTIGSSFSCYEFGLKQFLLGVIYPLLQMGHILKTAAESRIFADREQKTSWALLGQPDPYTVKSPALQKLMAFCLANKIPFTASVVVDTRSEVVIGTADDCIWNLTIGEQESEELLLYQDDDDEAVLSLAEDEPTEFLRLSK